MAHGCSAGVHVALFFDETQPHHWRYWNSAVVSHLLSVPV
jgi:S-formylglutathione hydrolase FrmB